MKVEFETKLRDLDLSNKAQMMAESSQRNDSHENSLQLQANLLNRIQKLEQYMQGLADGKGEGGNQVNTVVEDMPFKTDILQRI